MSSPRPRTRAAGSCRSAALDPNADAVAEAERCLARGARGIKLHPRAERFTLDHPEVERLFALAAERRLPILVHAGRGIPALGRHAYELTGRYPDARLILAHAGVSDLAWLWRHADERPNLLYDTSWWTVADFLALFSLVPPGRILIASDAPYGCTRRRLDAGRRDARSRWGSAASSSSASPPRQTERRRRGRGPDRRRSGARPARAAARPAARADPHLSGDRLVADALRSQPGRLPRRSRSSRARSATTRHRRP